MNHSFGEDFLHNCYQRLCLFDDTVCMLTFVLIFLWLPNEVYDMPAFPALDCFLKLRMVDSWTHVSVYCYLRVLCKTNIESPILVEKNKKLLTNTLKGGPSPIAWHLLLHWWLQRSRTHMLRSHRFQCYFSVSRRHLFVE